MMPGEDAEERTGMDLVLGYFRDNCWAMWRLQLLSCKEHRFHVLLMDPSENSYHFEIESHHLLRM